MRVRKISIFSVHEQTLSIRRRQTLSAYGFTGPIIQLLQLFQEFIRRIIGRIKHRADTFPGTGRTVKSDKVNCKGGFTMQINNRLRAVNPNGQLLAPEAESVEVSRLKELSLALSSAADILEIGGHRDIRSGLDFYEEVRRLEITLIKQALICSGGSQVKAAKLLKLRNTTLNSKIKNYGISIG